MFIAANIVCCRLRHQDARCTHRWFNKLVAVTILQSFAFFANVSVWGRGGVMAPTVRFAPVVPWAKAGPGFLENNEILFVRNCVTNVQIS
jgi:hypothetical protein